MFSETGKRRDTTAAWRVSAWTMLLFAVGTTVAFAFLNNFVAQEIRNRSDAWLKGEAEVIGEVAQEAPKGSLNDRVVSEIAELASKEVPEIEGQTGIANDSVFFIDVAANGLMKVWVGKGESAPFLAAIQNAAVAMEQPRTIRVKGFAVPFRVVGYQLPGADTIYLGLSEVGAQAVLTKLRIRFMFLWLGIVLLGFALVFFSTRHMLTRVQRITETASRIGRDNLDRRVPEGPRNDEISRLASTLNHMLDRIESSMRQLHTITDSLAHDLKSPITAIRGKLEVALSNRYHEGWTEPVASAVEELDRLSEFLNKSLDVAEANADALRLQKKAINLTTLLHSMAEIYEPSMSERGMKLQLDCDKEIVISADSSLVHRMLANLFDNELKHLPAGSSVLVSLQKDASSARLTIHDDGPGFPAEVEGRIFQRYAKGNDSTGSGLGLAFVEAVTRAHSGNISATNSQTGGARISLALPLTHDEGQMERSGMRTVTDASVSIS